MAPMRCHPLTLLTDTEIRSASTILRSHIQRQAEHANDKANLHFKNISLHDPPKALLLPHLDAEAAGTPLNERPYVPRCVDLTWTTDSDRNVTESVVDLDAGIVIPELGSVTGQGQFGPNDRYEVRAAAEKLLNDPRTLEAIRALHLPADAIVTCDPWMYGADRDTTTTTPKYLQALLYARAPHNHPDSNQYAFPLPFSPRYNLNTNELISIDPLATGGTEDGLAYHTADPEKPMAHLRANEYFADLPGGVGEERKNLKPLHVVQPEGPSFGVEDGNCVSWQKWRFRLGFNYREGVTVHDVRYEGRKVFYRLSVSEMTVPYGDPRSPYHRKQAFDLGDAGAGSCANNLALGCDCLGHIKYFSAWLNDAEGEVVPCENVICVHEQDGGIGWKHTNHRSGNAAITRMRELVVQSIITVGNYEYVFAWIFKQDASLELETRATGILSTSLIDPGKTSEWGNVVAPGVLAANHQHLFNIRIDPMVDGQKNTIIQEDSISLPQSEDRNPHGNAWQLVKTALTRSGSADAAPFANRCFKIVNEAKLNPISGNPVGYKLVPQPSQLLLAAPGSVVRTRAKFAEHHIWVTRYRDGDLWAGGKWTNQSVVEIDGVSDYAARDEAVRGEDVVVWHTFGMTHNPSVEQFPVMPVEVSTVKLTPCDFFERNPALDVPQSRQRDNLSKVVLDPVPTGEVQTRVGTECCEGEKAKL